MAQAVEQEAAAFLADMKGLRLSDGRDRVVRHGHGHGPERAVQTGIGPVPVSRVKIRDRGATDGDHIRFTSAILPRWARRTKSLDALLPTLYLRGVSTGDFQEALSALLGKEAPALSPSVISRSSIGPACGPQTPSKASSPPSATAPCGPRARARQPPPR